MEPVYVNKQIVWVHQQDQLENGNIGIFYLNGDAYIKKYQKNKDNVQLISLNKKYAPIQINYPLLRVMDYSPFSQSLGFY